MTVAQGFSQGSNQSVRQAAGISRVSYKRTCFPAHAWGCWQTSKNSLPGLITWSSAGLRSCGLLTEDIISLPHKGSPQSYSKHGSWITRVSKASQREEETETETHTEKGSMRARWEPQSFCNLISGVKSHHFGCILCVRRKSLGPVHTQGETIAQGMNTRRWGHWGYLRGCLPQCSRNILNKWMNPCSQNESFLPWRSLAFELLIREFSTVWLFLLSIYSYTSGN